MKMSHEFKSRPQRYQPTKRIEASDLQEYINARRVSNISDKWLYHIEHFISDYLKFCDYEVSKESLLTYLNKIRKEYHQSTYRKNLLDITIK